MKANNIIAGYVRGFETHLIKAGFFGFLAKTILAKKLANKILDKEDNTEENGIPLVGTDEGQMPGAPKKETTEISQEEQARRQAAARDNHKKIDPKIQQLAKEVGEVLPEEMRTELRRSGQLKQIATELAETQNASTQQSKRLFRHQQGPTEGYIQGTERFPGFEDFRRQTLQSEDLKRQNPVQALFTS